MATNQPSYTRICFDCGSAGIYMEGIRDEREEGEGAVPRTRKFPRRRGSFHVKDASERTRMSVSVRACAIDPKTHPLFSSKQNKRKT